jgi:hypothetical protein
MENLPECSAIQSCSLPDFERRFLTRGTSDALLVLDSLLQRQRIKKLRNLGMAAAPSHHYFQSSVQSLAKPYCERGNRTGRRKSPAPVLVSGILDYSINLIFVASVPFLFWAASTSTAWPSFSFIKNDNSIEGERKFYAPTTNRTGA